MQIVAEDILPKKICKKCLADLTFVYDFIKKCQKVQKILRYAVNCEQNIEEIKVREHDLLTETIAEIEAMCSESNDEEEIEEVPDEKEIEEADLSSLGFVAEIDCSTVKEEEGKGEEEKEITKPYCNSCDMTFKTIDGFRGHTKSRKHLKSLQQLTNDYKCSECSKECGSRYKLIEHMRTHTCERPYSCQLCPATFTIIANLRRHQIVHTGRKPYSCDVCSKCKFIM